MNDLYNNSTHKIDQRQDISGVVSWQAPSNIALIKYWGKKKNQIPRNPSLSLTLSKAITATTVRYTNRGSNEKWINFKFHGVENELFADRIERYFKTLFKIFPFLSQLRFDIESSNSFPHSSGIASSASSMAALALCLCDMQRSIFPEKDNDAQFLQKASFVARLGSGSASRSLIPDVAIWGSHTEIDGSSDYFAQSMDAHDVFKTFRDDILIVSSDKKSVSSSLGHDLMNDNPYASGRYKNAKNNLKDLVKALQIGDVEKLGYITEYEALSLHALMMCSHPPFMLMHPNTMKVINAVRKFRKNTGTPIFFTLDAGPNVHLLYPKSVETEAREFIDKKLLKHAHKNMIIRDFVGSGPVKIES